jgi:chorismate lyase/3-hydroxybenzoate synthase
MDVSAKTIKPAAPRASRRSVPIAAPRGADLGAPRWVLDLLAETGAGAPRHTGPGRQVTAGEAFTLVSVRIPGATHLAPAEFERLTAEAYAYIAAELRGQPARHPVRFWNYIPAIHRPCGDGLDRYMVFNAGRFKACSDWFGGPASFDRLLATASGVGHAGDDLVLHALAAAVPGVAVENPRQVPPYKYSRRFGPRPPCFARATVLAPRGGSRLVLVGGTASICGEESVHLGDLAAQTRETLVNLDALVRHAADVAGCTPAADALRTFTDLRVYHTRPQDRGPLAKLVSAAVGGACRVEYVPADLCRAELMVEIEGVATCA